MNIALPVLGGLGLFLYGMNLMGIGLQKAAGDRLKKLIEVLTNNRLMGCNCRCFSNYDNTKFILLLQ